MFGLTIRPTLGCVLPSVLRMQAALLQEIKLPEREKYH
jgi:hypothetical protein